jgi:hypothetical protein
MLAATAVVVLGRLDRDSGLPGRARIRLEQGIAWFREMQRWEIMISPSSSMTKSTSGQFEKN